VRNRSNKISGGDGLNCDKGGGREGGGVIIIINNLVIEKHNKYSCWTGEKKSGEERRGWNPS